MPIPILEEDRTWESFYPVNYYLFPSFYIDFDFFNLLLSSLSCFKSGIIADLKEFVYEFLMKLGEQVISSTTYGFPVLDFDFEAN